MSIFWLDEQACQNAEVCGGKGGSNRLGNFLSEVELEVAERGRERGNRRFQLRHTVTRGRGGGLRFREGLKGVTVSVEHANDL